MFQTMALPEFLRFTPVRLKARHDGWSPRVQFGFIVAIARGATIDSAACAVGKSRTTAYALRNRPGAESFAAAWDAALAYAKRRRLAARGVAAPALPPAASIPGDAAALLDSLYPGWSGEPLEAGEVEPA